MKRLCIFLALLCTAPLAANTDLRVGFVDARGCLESSKQGQKERQSFESMKKQMSESLEKSDKELADLAKKLEDPDYLEGLAPSAEEEMRKQFQTMSQKFVQTQNQYYQLLNQANMRVMQTLHESIALACESVRKAQNLSLVLSSDSTFAYADSLDVTKAVVEEMDKTFVQEGEVAQVPASK